MFINAGISSVLFATFFLLHINDLLKLRKGRIGNQEIHDAHINLSLMVVANWGPKNTLREQTPVLC